MADTDIGPLGDDNKMDAQSDETSETILFNTGGVGGRST